MSCNHGRYNPDDQQSILEKTFLGVKKRVSVSENIQFSGKGGFL